MRTSRLMGGIPEAVLEPSFLVRRRELVTKELIESVKTERDENSWALVRLLLSPFVVTR